MQFKTSKTSKNKQSDIQCNNGSTNYVNILYQSLSLWNLISKTEIPISATDAVVVL